MVCRSNFFNKDTGIGSGLIVFLLVIISVTLLTVSCKEKIRDEVVEPQRPVVTGITVQEVTTSSVDNYYETSGSVRSRNIAVLSSRMMGEVKSLNVQEGDFVRAGQVLISVDDMDIAERVRAAEAGYREALKGLEAAKQNRSLMDITYQRYKKLHDERAISDQELDQIETQKKVSDLEYERAEEMVNRARAGLSEARVYQGYTKVVAPFSGVVTEKKIEKGSMAVPGSPLLVIEDISSYCVEVSVDENLSGQIKRGSTVDVVVDSLGLETKGTVTDIVPSIDPISRTFLVKIELKVKGLRTGQYAKVRIPMGKKETILIPLRAVVIKGQLTGVYVLNEKGLISFRPVRAGKTYGERIEVLSGLRHGERIVADGVERVIDGGIIR